MATPVKVAFTIFKGGVFEHRFKYQTSAGAAIDITGYTARLYVREAYDSASAAINCTTENNKLVIDGPNGTIDLVIPASETEDLTIESGVFDLELIRPDEVVYKLAYGKVKVMPEATYDA